MEINGRMHTMKTSCPNCHQNYEIDDGDAGKDLECSACGKTFRAASTATPQPRHAGLIMCPACGSEISRRAERCQRCGEPVDRSAHDTGGEALGRVMRCNISPIISGILFLFAVIAGFLWLGNRDDIMTLVGSFWFLLAAIAFKSR